MPDTLPKGDGDHWNNAYYHPRDSIEEELGLSDR